MKTTNQYIVNEIDKIYFLKCCDHTSLRAIFKIFQKLKMHGYPKISYVECQQAGWPPTWRLRTRRSTSQKSNLELLGEIQTQGWEELSSAMWFICLSFSPRSIVRLFCQLFVSNLSTQVWGYSWLAQPIVAKPRIHR